MEMSEKAVKFGELLTGIEKLLSELTAEVRNDELMMPDEKMQKEEIIAKLVTQKDALSKKRLHCLQLSEETNRCNKTKEEMIARVRQQLAASEEACAMAAKRNVNYDQERQTVARLKDKVRQNISQRNEQIEKDLQRAEEHVSLLSTLSGFKVKSVVDRHQVIIELIDPVKEAVDSVDTQTVDEEFLTSKRPTTSLELTITYTQQAVPRLADVKVNVESLAVDDLVQNAIQRNDVHHLLSAVRQRWLKHSLLAAEIEPLRHRFALDWLYTEGLIRVLYGSDASIVCTLKLNNYPECASSVGITLQSASGLPPGMTLETLQLPSAATVSLKEALEFLDSRLSSVHHEHAPF